MSGGVISRRGAIAGAAGLAATGWRARAAIADPAVSCPAGRFVGARERGMSVFRGVRYGSARRFEAPVASVPAGDPVSATSFGPVCPQHGKRRPQSEDCLSLNVWSSTLDARARLPVLVWVHGGGYAVGSANDAITDGGRLAARGDVVVVTVNHRLNAFGYLHLAGLTPAYPDSGNAGQLDLVLALRWVRDNIAAFGGDPSCVTVIGQSGGGAKIATLMAMPIARGLFHRAVTMSGQQVTVSGPGHATRRTRAVMAALGLGAGDAASLAAVAADRLVAALQTHDPIEDSDIYTGPVIDGRWIARHPFWPDAHPAGRHVPLMLGGTRDETRDFFDPASLAMRGLTWDDLPSRIAAELPCDAPLDVIVATYKARRPSASPADIFYAATTVGRSWRPQLIEAEARARAGCAAYLYQMNFASRTDPARGAFHGIDIGLLFGTLEAPDAWTGTDADARQLSRRLQDHVIAFARAGTPTRRGLPVWPSYDLTDRQTMIFDKTSRVERDPRPWQRALFAPYPYTQPGT